MKTKIEAINKTQTEGILEMENLGKWAGNTKASIQDMKEKISGTEDTIEEIESLVKENVNSNKFLTQNIQEIWDIMKRPNLWITGIEEVVQLKGTEKYIQQNQRRKRPQAKEGHAYESTRSLHNTKQTAPKKKENCHIMIKTLNIQNRENTKSCKGKRPSDT